MRETSHGTQPVLPNLSAQAEEATLGCEDIRMTWLRSRRIREAAEAWKRERIGRLQAECLVLETLLRATRDELAHMRELQGKKLLYQYGCLTDKEVDAEMREREEFMEMCGDVWLEGEHTLKAKGHAA